MGKPTIRPYQNPYELSFRQWAEGQGWEVSKSGWPDFLCRRGQEVMAVEVKGGNDTLSAEQRRTIANLRQAGMPTFVWSPEFGLSDDAAPVSESSLSLMAEITRLRTLISEMIALRNEPPWEPPTWVGDLGEKVQGGFPFVPAWGSLMADEEPNGLEGIHSQVAALRRELKLIWDGHHREHTQHEESHGREHQFAQMAIDKAAELAEQNKDDADQWRTAMAERERTFATKADSTMILDRLDKIERAGIIAIERESTRIADDAEEKRQAERRTARSQWTVGLVVGLAATFGAIVINLIIRLSTAAGA